jgi:class 3 adenylate cyclase/tetratricopeptide (TPR) repeat protein
MATCAACGASNPERFRFCGTCGAALGGERRRTQVRKVVTVLFVDVTGSTELGERLDPEAMRRAMGRYFSLSREIIERHGGTVEKFIGDAVMAVFGIPQVHEDDALRAVRAASEIRQALQRLNEELRSQQGIEISVRIGLNTGEVVAGEGESAQTLVTGDPVNTAARLEEAASAGEIVIGEATQRLVGPLTTTERIEGLTLKGKQEPVTAYRLLDVAERTATAPRQLEGPMVGRKRELHQLTSVLQRVIGERICHLFTIVGGAGVGKSRLVREFVAASGIDARVLRGRCLPYGDGITYWPIMEIAREAAGIEPADTAAEARSKLATLTAELPDSAGVAESVAAAIGLSVERSGTEQIAWGVRKLLEGLARERPLVVITDDIQWAEAALLDLIEEVATWVQDAPLMLLCMARTELHDERPAWSGGVLNSTTVLLEPLPADDSAALIGNLVGAEVLAGSLGRRIVESAEGNPLFVEEMIGMLIDAGILMRQEGRWTLTGDVERVEVPPTIHALLAARLDGLPPDERAVAQRGSVIGRTFERVAVSELSPEAERTQVVEHLRGLVRRQVIGPFQADDVYRFRHLLIRDAAYEALPKEERAELHERFADWLEAVAGDRLVENEEILGYHLEQAHDYREGLGQRDDHVGALAARAGGWLAIVGHRADARRDVRAARGLLTRAVRLLPVGHPAHWRARLDLGSVLSDAGEMEASADLLRRVAEGPKGVPQEIRIEARLYHAWVELDRSVITMAEAKRRIAEVICAAARGRHYRVLGRAWSMAGGIYQNAVDVKRATRAFERAARFAALGEGDDDKSDILLRQAGLGARSRMPVSEVLALVERALALPNLSRAQQVRAEQTLAYLYALQGRFEEARELMVAAMRELEDRGRLEHLTNALATLGLIEIFAGQYPAAREHMIASRDLANQSGNSEWSTFMSARLAHVYMLEGNDEEALANARLVEMRGALDPWYRIVVAGAESRVMSRRGETAEAVERARAMVADAEAAGFVDYPVVFASALEDLAEVLGADGQTTEACEVLNRVIAMQRAKENVVGVANAERALTRITGEQQA